MNRPSVVFGIAALAIGCLAIGVAGCSSVRGTGPVSIDQSSPASVAKAYQQAYEERNFAAMLACVKPSQQGRADPGLVVAKEFSDRVVTVSDFIRDRFGDELADELVRMCGRVLGSPFDVTEEDGVNWDRITFDVEGDIAQLRLDGRAHHGVPQFERVRGKWFIAHDYEETPSTPMIGAGLLRAYYRQGMEKLKTLEDHLRHYRVNEEDVWELVLAGDIARPGITVQDICLEIGPPGEHPVFRRSSSILRGGAPLMFYVTASYAVSRQGSRPICWSMPSLGLGEGIVVKIDGEEIPQPQHAPDVVRSLQPFGPSVYAVTWWFALPPEIELDRGVHTIQYSLTSGPVPSAQLPSPDMSVLEGILESNVLRFLVRRGASNRLME